MKFAIVIPAGPVFSPTIEKTFQSIAVQNAEVAVALCDVSDSVEIKGFADQYSNLIAYRRYGPDEGQSAAINEGWSKLDAEIYAWLNVDDYLAPNALEIVSEYFRSNPSVDVVYGQSLIAKDGKIIGQHTAVEPISPLMFRSNIISQPSCFVRRKALFDVGLLNESLHYVMDWDLWIRLYEYGAQFSCIQDQLSCVLWHQDTKTATLAPKRYAEIRSLMKGRASAWHIALSQINFLIEHLADYGALQPLFRVIRAGMSKIGRRAKVRTVENIALFHFCDGERGVKITFKRLVASDIYVDGERVFEGEADSVMLPVSIAPETVYNLRMQSKNGEALDWECLEYCKQ